MTATLATFAADLTALLAERDRLAARVAELEAAQRPARMLVGASVGRRGFETPTQAINAWEADVGQLQVRRIFSPTGAGDFASLTALDARRRARVVSFKGEAALLTVDHVRSLPDDGLPTWLCWQHEPERKDKANDPAWFRAGTERVVAVIRAAGRPDVHPTIINTSYFERDRDPSTNTPDWWPDDIGGLVLGVDPYDPRKDRTLAEQCTPTLDAWRAHGGKRWLIAETGTQRTGTDGAAWITDGARWAASEGCEALCWFHSDVGDFAWWLDDPAMRAAWGAL